MDNCKPVSTPLVPNQHLLAATGIEEAEFTALGINYCSAIGSLNYLSTTTQPDLSFESDADWGNFHETQRSVTSYLTNFNGCLILCKTFKQPTVSLPTLEAKYKSLCDLTSKLLWLHQWCEETSLLPDSPPILVHEDNQGCISTANGDSSINSKRMKHVDIQLHFVKEAIKTSRIRLVYTATNDILANFLTKSTPWATFCHSLKLLSVVCLGVRGGGKYRY
ncbi:hypothetical protein O181_132582 [Austropuccinia psidii MF-1]|uniref:Reverse transcriptase Ty1/copia-type domain-containing protein n=1 Tax=Austropuccinia psidii MF-1 TaxID=1389203 RepID=A0A9Q3QDY7_9BASI|nr:hypothetical protein [Austropuccinia psidii MF-1]